MIFPPCLCPDTIASVELPQYHVVVFTSNEGVESRYSYGDCNYDAKLTLEWNSAQNNVAEEVIKLWGDTHGDLLSFHIPEDHKLWYCYKQGGFNERLGYAKALFDLIDQPFWRFVGPPKITTEVSNIHDITIEIKSTWS
jgi:hypothetical protein